MELEASKKGKLIVKNKMYKLILCFAVDFIISECKCEATILSRTHELK